MGRGISLTEGTPVPVPALADSMAPLPSEESAMSPHTHSIPAPAPAWPFRSSPGGHARASRAVSLASLPADQSTIDGASPLPAAGLRSIALELRFRHAGRRRLQIACEWQGPRDAPAVWVAGGISADHHLASCALDGSAGWWENAVGPGRGLDPTRYRLICADWVGADGRIDAPIDSADQADAIAAVLDALGIEQLHGFVGASYGAMVGLAFAARHGHRLQRLVALSGADRAHPYASAFRALQRQVVALGELQCDGARGLALARQLAMLSYRTPQEFGERFTDPVVLDGARARGPAEDYLGACGARYAARWSPTAFLRLSESIDLHCVDPAEVRVPTTLLAIEQDWLVPPADIERVAHGLGAPARVHRLDSRYGHDAFLKETAAVNALLRDALEPAESVEGVAA
jgi:homoserine O-acetyltransferase/O-succinyltransferase